MIDIRKKMLERVRAILAKTITAGCTEGEAFVALAKAYELMAVYDISEAELGLTEETEGAVIHQDANSDPYRVKRQLAYYIGRLIRCKTWYYSGESRQAFCGLESDVAFATWLSDALAAFVLRELKAHQERRRVNGLRCPRIVGSSFVLGCAERIGYRLQQLTPQAPVTATGNALTTSRKALIDEAIKMAGIKLGKASSRSRRINEAAYGSGQRGALRSTCIGRR